MRRLHFDSIGGVSGDMVLAALVGLGAEECRVREALGRLPVHGYVLEFGEAVSRGIAGTQARVLVERHGGQGRHHHRRLNDILGMVDAAGLTRGAAGLAGRTFRRLADAEARVHGCRPDEVHFHEIGAVDSIVDIIASCVAMDMLGVDSVTVGPLPLGSGSVKCEHGIMPVPAPATVLLLAGHEVESCEEEPFELVTPTGAVLLMVFKTGPVPAGVSRLAGVANAIGHRELTTRPNLLRAFLFESEEADNGGDNQCLVLECNIDDSNPELLGSAMGRVIADAGAWDAFFTPVQMKKQRPGVVLTVLCDPTRREQVLDLLFRETTTFGVRESVTRRTMLARRWAAVATEWGEVRVKIGTWNGRDVTLAPEYDDCVRCASGSGVPVRVVYEAALVAAAVLRE